MEMETCFHGACSLLSKSFHGTNSGV
jgi:hypothetical protein